jgi:micrococcal nuclease
LPPAGQPAPEPAPAPRQLIPAEVLRVVDGDTVEVRATIWLDQQVTTRVRIRDIDAPELGARCPEEARKARAAASALEQALAGRRLFLADLGRDKYGGRVVARIVAGDGSDIGRIMLAAGHARPYAGRARTGWC